MRSFASHVSRERHPTVILLEESDPLQRSAAHLELGHRALARDNRQLAETHYREAAQLNPSDPQAAQALQGIGATLEAARRPRGGLFGWLRPVS